MKKWRIWYNNNVVIECDNEQEWADAPELGVQAIYEFNGYDKHGARLGVILNGSDWYWIYQGNAYQSNTSNDEVGVWVHNPAPEGSISKRGQWTTDEEMARISQELVDWITDG